MENPIDKLRNDYSEMGKPVAESHKQNISDTLKQGDILLYIGDEGESVGVVKDVNNSNGIAKVGSGNKSVSVAPHSFIEVIPRTEKSLKMAKYLNRSFRITDNENNTNIKEVYIKKGDKLVFYYYGETVEREVVSVNKELEYVIVDQSKTSPSTYFVPFKDIFKVIREGTEIYNLVTLLK